MNSWKNKVFLFFVFWGIMICAGITKQGFAYSKYLERMPVNDYCLICHSKPLKMVFKDGTEISVRVDKNMLIHSVHKNLKCTDCHVGYSKTSHPIKEYPSYAAFRKEATQICAKCHQKEMMEWEESVHAKVNGPNCLACHGYPHHIQKITGNIAKKTQVCSRCHHGEFMAFKNSVHFDKIACSDCHEAHKIITNGVALENQCFKCHKNMLAVHGKWLKNPPVSEATFVKLHFEKAECTVCHAKGKKEVELSLKDESNKQITVSPEDVKKFDKNGNGVLDEDELIALKEYIEHSSGKEVSFDGMMKTISGLDAHEIMPKNMAVRKCVSCHSPSAKFKVSLEDKMPVNRTVLGSIYNLENMKDFYVLGLTKIRVMDILAILAVICGAGFVVGHVGLRILFTPIRNRRKKMLEL